VSIPTNLSTPTVIERVYRPAPDGRRFIVVRNVRLGKGEVILSEGVLGQTTGGAGK
jgi:hypothetical protein